MNYINSITRCTLYKYEIIVSICFIFLICYSIYRRNKLGTWYKYHLRLKTNYTPKIEHAPLPTGNLHKGDSKGEIECRRVLEKIFNKKFNKIRPDFLKNPVTGNNFNLELDCYNEELKLAVEYQGCQHYKYTPYFHKNKESFYNQKYRDLFKRQKCVENKITLIDTFIEEKKSELQYQIENYLV